MADPAPPPHVLLFELYAGGHQLQYLRTLADCWARLGCRGRLSIAVPRAFLDARPQVAGYVSGLEDAGVHLVPIAGTPRLGRGGLGTILRNDLESGRFLQRAIAQVRPTHAVMMYVDHMQASLALRLRLPHPVALAGIYFQPSFHNGALGQRPESWKERLRRLRKAVTLYAALRHPALTHLFCLDPYVVPHVRRMTRRVDVVHLPDGIPAAAPPDAAAVARTRAALGVEAGRRLLLLFGSLARRKGTFELLDAVERLPAELAREAAVALVGAVRPDEREAVTVRVEAVTAASPAQVLLHDAFVPEEAVQGYLDAADLALLPYQRHVGSSGVLIRAAAAGRPVLASDYGLVGENTRRHRLGLAVDTTDPAAIAHGLAAYLRAPGAYPFDPAGAARFAAIHTADRMAETLFGRLGALAVPAPPPGPAA